MPLKEGIYQGLYKGSIRELRAFSLNYRGLNIVILGIYSLIKGSLVSSEFLPGGDCTPGGHGCRSAEIVRFAEWRDRSRNMRIYRLECTNFI